MARKSYNEFHALLKTVPLVLTCERQSEYPTLSDKEEKFLFDVVREFEAADESVGKQQNIRQTKGEKIRRLVEKYLILSIYDEGKDQIVRFYKDNKPPQFDEVVAVMGDKKIWLVKQALREEAVIVIRVKLTPTTDIAMLDKASREFAADIKGYREEDKIPIEDEVDEGRLREVCRQHHVGFPARVFRKVKKLRRYVDPKFKPGGGKKR